VSATLLDEATFRTVLAATPLVSMDWWCDEGNGVRSTHYVVLGYALPYTDAFAARLPVEQHARYAWFEAAEVLSADAVHPNTKAYMQDL